MGTGAYELDAGGTIQWWCHDHLHERYHDSPVPFSGLTPLRTKAFEGDWEPICLKDFDCPHPESGQICTDVYWDAIEGGSQFGKGEACYNWDSKMCPGDPFGEVNKNYEQMGWSHYV